MNRAPRNSNPAGRWIAAGVLAVAAAGCGADGKSPATAPATPAPEQAQPPGPPIEITPVSRGISVTSENQILVEMTPEDLDPVNPLDLAGRTVIFTPVGGGSYSREVRALAWEEELGQEVDDNDEVELGFRFEFSGQRWDSVFFSRYGLVTFGERYPFGGNGPDRFGTMAAIADYLGDPPMIAALYKPQLGGWSTYDADQFRNTQHVSRRPDQVVVTWITTDPRFHVHGVPPQEKTRFQMTLHADGRIAFHYASAPEDPDEAIHDGVVGLFPRAGVITTALLGRIPDPTDRSLPGHLDLVETAVYATDNPDLVLVEFTTRDSIHPIPDRELIYRVEMDTDEPWTGDREDRDLLATVVVQPDGARTSRWDAVKVARYADDEANRIGVLMDSRALPNLSASVIGRSQTFHLGTHRRDTHDEAEPIVFTVPEATSTDLSESSSRPSVLQTEVFHYPEIDPDLQGRMLCRIIDTLGDEFDLLVLNGQFRVDWQVAGPTSGRMGPFRAEGIRPGYTGKKGSGTGPCDTRPIAHWGFPVWIKAPTVVDEGGGEMSYDLALTLFAHEFGHAWLAYAHYQRDGKALPLEDGGHWAHGLHAPAPFPLRGQENGSVMGGNFWRENRDGTFTPTSGWSTKGGGFSWLDLYLMGLATPDEVPDMFVLHNLKQVGERRDDAYTAEKEIVTIEQIIARMGPRDPPAARAQKVFNTGFVYFLLPGQEPDPELLDVHVKYRDRAVEYWHHVTGGRSQLTTAIPAQRP